MVIRQVRNMVRWKLGKAQSHLEISMNKLLEHYVVDVDYPEVSGIEHLQMLETRSQLAALEARLSTAEQRALAVADYKLATHVVAFLAELNRFVNLAQERQQRPISPREWWWYLDVLVQAPALPQRATTVDNIGTRIPA